MKRSYRKAVLIAMLFVSALVVIHSAEEPDTLTPDSFLFERRSRIAGDYMQQVLERGDELCEPAPCLHPESETEPLYQLREWEREEIDRHREQLAYYRSRENQPKPDESDIDALREWSIQPEPMIETLRFHASVYNEGFDDLTPYAFTRLMLIDVAEAPQAARIYRRYELRRQLQFALTRMVQLEELIALNAQHSLTDPQWLEAELKAVWQMRRFLHAELQAREIEKERGVTAALIGGGEQ